MSTFEYDGVVIHHQIKPNLKHAYIKIEEGRVHLKSSNISSLHVNQILSNKIAWIKKKLLSSTCNELDYCKEMLYLGEKLIIQDSDELLHVVECFEYNSFDKAEDCLRCQDLFYKVKAQEYLPQRVEYFSNLMKLYPAKLNFRKTKRQWGSCSSKKTISLNTSLMKLRVELIDYVVVHELAHLKHMNHSKEFHNLTQIYLKNAKKLRDELKTFKTL